MSSLKNVGIIGIPPYQKRTKTSIRYAKEKDREKRKRRRERERRRER